MLHGWAALVLSSDKAQIATLQSRVEQLERQLQEERSNALSVDATGKALLQRRFLYRADINGHFAIPSRLTRFSMDVGFNVGSVMIGDWLSRTSGPATFMIGVEANPYLYTLFDTIITEQPWPRGYEGMFWQPNDGMAHSAAGVAHARTFRSHADQLLLVHAAAVSTIQGAAEFHLGIGWNNSTVPDVGSIFRFQSDRLKDKSEAIANGNIRNVATIRLDELLGRVPPPPRLHWDTLKIDIQGADTDALKGAGRALERFMCVIGEFTARHYDLPSGISRSPKHVLNASGFRLAMASTTPRLQVWINTRFRSVFEGCLSNASDCAQFTCSAHIKGQPDKIAKQKIAKAVRDMPMP